MHADLIQGVTLAVVPEVVAVPGVPLLPRQATSVRLGYRVLPPVLLAAKKGSVHSR
jgi:hypothetical protein